MICERAEAQLLVPAANQIYPKGNYIGNQNIIEIMHERRDSRKKLWPTMLYALYYIIFYFPLPTLITTIMLVNLTQVSAPINTQYCTYDAKFVNYPQCLVSIIQLCLLTPCRQVLLTARTLSNCSLPRSLCRYRFNRATENSATYNRK